MNQRWYSSMSAAVIVLLFTILLGAQVTPEEHASHHPGQDSPTEVGVSPGGAGAMEGMAEMMQGMGAPPPKELYPTLMELSGLSAEERAEVKAAAHERMKSGTVLMAEGLDRLVRSAPTDDYEAMQEAVALLREGMARFDSGLAAYRALSENQDGRAIAMNWFRSQMNLTGPPVPAGRWSVLGLSAAHLSLMVILIGFALAMIAMYFFKMRRASTLLRRLTETPRGPWGGSLRVARIFAETPSIKTFRLLEPVGGPIPFTFLPGQFLTLTVARDGRTVKRSYTIASSPAQRGYIEITVKREEQGFVSRYLCDEVREGTLLQVSAPQGYFTFTGKEAESIVLIGAGVGITPLMSVIRYLTDRAWPKDIYLLFSCRTPDQFAFGAELEHLHRRHANLHFVATVTGADGTEWTGLRGRFTKELIAQSVPGIASRRVHLCGPAPMMDAMRAMLLELGVPAASIKSEGFGPPPGQRPHERQIAFEAAVAQADPDAPEVPTVLFTISSKTAPLPADVTVLEVAEHIGVSIDYSCRVGTCGACKVKLRKGTVTMAVEDGLPPGDKASGIILACQAKATESLEVEA